MRSSIITLSAILAVLVAAGAAQATIPGGIGDASLTPSTGAGEIKGSGPDYVVVYKDFNSSLPNTLGPVDINVTVGSAGDYWIREESYSSLDGLIHNSSGQAWTGFRFELIPAEGFNFVAGSPWNDVFSTVNRTDTLITLSGGSVPNGDNLQAHFQVHADDAGTFTIREMALPEPATLSLLALGGLALLRRRIRR